jgi:hypothetical protein
VTRGSNGSGILLRSGVLGFAVILTAGACSSATNRAAATGCNGVSATTESQFTPSGTLPPLVAPPRSFKPVFAGEEGAVEKALRAFVDALDRKDVDAVVALRSKPDPSYRDSVVAFVNNFSIRLYRINAIVVKGTTATIDYEDAIVGHNLTTDVTTLLAQHDAWTNEGGSWKNVSEVNQVPGIPQDLGSVTVTLRDGAPITVPPLPDCDFAFLLNNTGHAPKGVFILGIPADLDVAAFIPTINAIAVQRQTNSAAPYPAGILEMGATADVPANGTGTMVFTARLPKGRFLLLGRTAGDNPTLLPNEYADFTVK